MHFGECKYILYNIEMIMLTVEMMWVLLTHIVENTSGVFELLDIAIRKLQVKVVT